MGKPMAYIHESGRSIRPSPTIKCHDCGKFIKYGLHHYHFFPETHYEPEESWFICRDCMIKE